MFLCKTSNILKLSRPLLISGIVGLEDSCARGLALLITKGDHNQKWGSHNGIPYLQRNNSGKTLLCNYSKDSCESLVNESTEKASDEKKEEEESLEKIFEEISQGNADIMKKLKILEFEVAIHREHNEMTPKLNKTHWETLLSLPNITQKKKYLIFVFKNQKKNEHLRDNKRRKVESRLERVQKIQEETGILYKLGSNSLFTRINDRSLLRLHFDKLMGAKMFSQHVVFDCSYDSFMTSFTSKLCAKQLALSFYANRMHPVPFEVKLCNVNPSSPTIKFLNKIHPTSDKENYPWEVFEKSYLDLYPKKQLVYLTPHCNNDLVYYDHDVVYIIGAFVDKGLGVKASLAKAKKQDLKMARLPIDRFIQWGSGTKNLPLNLVLRILLDRQMNTWETALNNLPRRCLKGYYYDDPDPENDEDIKMVQDDDETPKKSTEIL